MAAIGLAGEVLGAMITPAVLISAGGTLVLSTSNRLSRVVDRTRSLAATAERMLEEPSTDRTRKKRTLITRQLRQLSARVLLLRSALTALYTAIGLLIATSISVGILALLESRFSWLAVGLGLMGASFLLYGSFLLVREARLAVSSTLEEMAFVRTLVDEPDSKRA